MKTTKPATKKAAKDVGTFHRKLEEPVEVGEITAREAQEVKALNALNERLRDEAEHAQRVYRVASAHRLEYLRSLLVARGLDTDDLYNINDDSGVIAKTHELAPTEIAVVEEPKKEDAQDVT